MKKTRKEVKPMVLSFLEEIDPDNIKFGGVFYHHKKIDSGNLNRSILRQSEEARKTNSKVDLPESAFDLSNIISKSTQQVFDKFFDFKENVNSFSALEESLKNEKEEFINDFLYSDTVIMLPFNGFSLDYKELNEKTPLSLIVLTHADIHVGFFTPRRFLKEYLSKKAKV